MKLVKNLMLWWRDLLHVDPGHWIPPSVRVTVTVTIAVTDPESHFHFSLADLLAHSFNHADTVKIFDRRFAASHIDDTVNGFRGSAFATIKGEVPPLTAGVAVVDTKWAIEENAQSGMVWLFLVNTFLREFECKKKDEYENNFQNV